MTEPYTLPLSDPQADLATVGGKGASLARLVNAGLPVPDGFHITTVAYRAFVDENALQPRILEALRAVDTSQPATLEAASAQIGALFADGHIPAAVTAAIEAAYAALAAGAEPVAVRSSATAEDLPDASFAGQQETFLNMRGVEPVLAAVKRCWASLWTARAIGYRVQNAIDQEIVSLAVVVQALVPAEAAGIMFTANPMNGRRDQCVVSASWGLGEAVVGGMVTPDSFTVDKTNQAILVREIADKQTMTARVDGGTEEVPVPEAKRQAAALEDAQVVALAQRGTEIEALYGMPMDIEWAVMNGKTFILQARPITALPEPVGDLPTEWSLPVDGAVYMRAGIIEQLPDPVSPLYATLAQEPMTKTIRNLVKELGIKGMGDLLDVIGFDVINGYVYMFMEISVWKFLQIELVSILQAGKIFRNAATVWCDVFRPRYLKSIANWQAHPPQAFTATELLAGARELLYRGMEMYTGAEVAIPAAIVSEISFARFYNKLVKRQGDPPAQAFVLGSDSQPILADKALYDLAQWSREQPALAEYWAQTPADQVVSRLGREESPPGVADEVWQGWRSRFNEHLAQFGHAIYNMDFVNPVPADAPAPLIETLKFYMQRQGTSPYQRQQEIVERREQATQAVLARLGPVRRAIFGKLLTWAQNSAPDRENALAAVGLGWPLLRQLLRELGRRLVEAGAVTQRDDVFWLEAAEVSQAAAALDAGQPQLDSLADLVAERKMQWRGRMRVAPPQLLPKDSWLAKLFGRLMPAHSAEQTGVVIKGIAVGEGKVTAKARVLNGPKDFGAMQPGEVLVTGITTPAWTPLFALASAVVTDIGGPLSHSSIVAREYGIPAVLGTGMASKRIQSGQMITVDGDAGTVTLLDQ
jgi:phosphohistidine swiveling domain-containing protein